MLMTNVIIIARFEVFTSVFTDVQLLRDVTSPFYISEDLNSQTVENLKGVSFLVFRGDGCRDYRLLGCDAFEKFRK